SSDVCSSDLWLSPGSESDSIAAAIEYQPARPGTLGLSAGTSRNGPATRSGHRLPLDFGRRHAEAPPETAIEVGQVAEPGVERDRADAATSGRGVAQAVVHAIQPGAEHEVGEARPRAQEQVADVARADAVTARQPIQRKRGPAEIGADVGLDRGEPGPADAAPAALRPRVACRPGGQCRETDQVAGAMPGRMGAEQFQVVLHE